MQFSRTRLFLGAASALAALFAASPALAYRTLADVEGADEAIAWDAPPRVRLDLASFPSALRETAAIELDQAARVWNRVSCTDTLLVVDHAAVVPDVTVRVEPSWAAEGFDADAAATTDVVLQSAPEGGARLVGATVHLNGTMRWRAHGEARRSTDRDLRVVLTHELGHVLGLAHNCEVGDAALECGDDHRGIVMHPVYGMGGGVRLAGDDTEGVCSLYEGLAPAPAECVSSSECFEGEVCLEGRCQLDDSFGAACSQRSDCSTSYCIADATSPAGGICTRACDANADCPSGAACIPVKGQAIHVCSAVGSTATCSVGPGHAPAPLFFVLLLAAGGLLVSRRVGCRP